MPFIDPDKLYRLSEAAALIPSSHTACGVTTATLRNWIKAGRLRTVERPAGKLVYHFVKGEEIVRILTEMELAAGPKEIPLRPDQTPEHKAARAQLDARWAKRRQRRDAAKA